MINQYYIHVACMLCVSVWAVCSPSQAQDLLHFGSAVGTLSRISCLHIYCPQGSDNLHSTPPPEGSLIGVVDHSCQLHLHVQVCAHSYSCYSQACTPTFLWIQLLKCENMHLSLHYIIANISAFLVLCDRNKWLTDQSYFELWRSFIGNILYRKQVRVFLHTL